MSSLTRSLHNRFQTRFVVLLIVALVLTIGLVQKRGTFVRPVHASTHAAFTPGNLVIYRVGDASGALVGTGNPVFLDEYTPAGAFVQSIALPTTDSLPNQSLIANGTSTSEGLLTRSADGQFLILTGYDVTPPHTGTVSSSTSAAVNRVIGRVDGAGTINTTTALSDAFSGGNIRSATSTDGTTLWATGSVDGVRTTTLGSTTSTVIASGVTNLRQVNIFNSQLYVSSGSGTTRVATVGSGTPTTAGQTITNVPNFPTTGGTSPYGFYFADLDAGVAGVDTLYVCDDSAFALKKYSLVAGNWTLNGTVGVDTDDYRGLIATVSGSTVTLYATRKAGAGVAGATGELVTLVDSTGYNGAFAGTPTILATAVTNTAFRGVALAPGAPPETAPTVLSTTPTNGASSVVLSSNIAVNFSEPVNVSGSSFTISCATSGAHTFVLSGSSAAYSLNPDSDFAGGELCTVTVVANQVSDVDVNDPPNNMAADFVFSFTTVDPGSCGTAFTGIYTIQGSGTASPLVGSNLTTEGVVIGDFQGSANLSGFYIQDPTGDANPATSDGIFVFDGATPALDVNVGDRVRITGMIAETFNNTQIVPSSIIVCSTGNTLPAPVNYDLPEPVNNDLERVENMLVSFPETLTVTGNFGLGRFGEAVLSSEGRLFQQNNFDRTNSPGALAVAQLNPRRYVVLDDGRSIQNPDPTPYFNASNTRRVGDTVTGLTGVLTFDFSEYRLQPTTAPVFVSANPRTAAPDPVGGLVRASSFNVLNYFNGNGAGGGFPTSRGATTLAEFNRQRDKIIAAILAINADVYGVIEIENDGSGAASAIQDLVNGLNAVAGAGTYAFADGTTPGTDEIKNSIIYKTTNVTPDGAAVNDTDAIWAGQARNPLAQTFTLNSNGAKFVFIVNHFTSKGCSANDTGLDADQGDGQGCDNLQRTLQAEALLEFVEERQTTTGQQRVLVMGDLNSYGEEDPIFRLENDMNDTLVDGPGGLIDEVQRWVPVANRYSYQFDESSGYLDHALASKELNPYISGTTIWHINADEPTVLDYNLEFKSVAQQGINVGTPYRASDHDPVVVGINLLLPTAADGSISGRITDPNGLPIAGAVVNLSGTQSRKFITDANGNYRFEGVETNGFYTVRPERANYSFTPAERSFSQLSNNTEAVFTGILAGGFGNPIATPEYFVRQHYLDFLGREPDEAGFNFWSDQILECGGDSACIERRTINVSAAYFLSIEFRETGGLVDGLYRASYDRAPRYAEFLPDSGAIAAGVIVGRPGWAQQLAANKAAFVDGWMARPEFHAAYDGLGNAAYVDALIAHAGGFNGDRNALVSGLDASTLSRAGALRQIVENDGFMEAKRNASFVMMEYFGYLRRDPDASGYQFWLSKLNQFDGNFEQAEMVKAFIVSGEYRDRFRQQP